MMDYGICGAGPGTTPVPAAVASLLAPDGQALLAELRDIEVTPDSALELGTRLRQRYPAGLVASALAQQELRWRARAKFSRAMDMYFTRDGLEQASAEPVARHRAGRLAAAAADAAGAAAGRTPVIADLCCGIGGDLVALAEAAEAGLVLAVDRDPVHLAMAGANAAVCGLAGRVRAWAGDVRDAPLDGCAAVFIDPARRDGGRRMAPGASEPPLDWCLSLAGRVPLVAVKAAPGLALEDVPGGLGDRVHRRGPGPEGGRAVVPGRWPARRPGPPSCPAASSSPRCRTARPARRARSARRGSTCSTRARR